MGALEVCAKRNDTAYFPCSFPHEHVFRVHGDERGRGEAEGPRATKKVVNAKTQSAS